MVNLDMREVTYNDILSFSGNFVALDISVRGTGWCRWLDGEFTFGVVALKEEDAVKRRFEFASFLKDLCGKHSYDYIIVEDVIASCNFKTAKILIQLNSIIDDLVFVGEVKAKEVIREDNKVWKKYLKQLVGYQSKILAGKDKDIVVECMNLLAFNHKVQQDVYDVVGIACGVIKKTLIDKDCIGTKKLKTDITKGYTIKQFRSLDAVDVFTYSKQLGVYNIEVTESHKDVKSVFKKVVNEVGDDFIFVIKTLTKKLGVLAMHKNLSLVDDVTYLVVFKNVKK